MSGLDPPVSRAPHAPAEVSATVGQEDGVHRASTRAPDATVTVRAAESLQSRSIALLSIAVILVFGALYFARAFFMPVILAFLLSLVFSPPVRWLARYHVPPPAGAALILLAAMAVIGTAGYELATPVRDWLAAAPATVSKATRKLRLVSKPVEQVTMAADQVDRATSRAASAPTVVMQGPSLSSRLFGTSEVVLAGAIEVILLLYSLLAVGDLFLEKLVDMLPRRGDREKAVSIARTTEAAISSYLFITAIINIGEGVVVAVVMAFLGMPTPWLWGALVAAAEFIPYLGVMSMLVVLTVGSITTFSNVGHALLVPAALIAINFIQANIVSPLVMSRRLTLNPVVIFLALALWWWMWGIAGAFLAVPLLAVFKILCDHVESLASIGEFLGGRDKSERRGIVRVRLAAAAIRGRSRQKATAAE